MNNVQVKLSKVKSIIFMYIKQMSLKIKTILIFLLHDKEKLFKLNIEFEL